ncbi:MAG: carboxypeptidase-like regulatory domain-containing protein [Flavobacteriaceae bacterium]|nr:carboxypeptidase-like regulatory domain-containing protein [Flavobacteriaceae bacterium]
MTKQLLLILFFAFSITVFSQEVERIKISGKISASKGEDVEGINIYNKSSQKGTATSASGEFEISVAENDRISFSAMQFQNFTVIIDQGILESKTMNIMLNPVINQLDEVLIRPYDLSGNIIADVKRINVTSVSNEFDLSYKTMEFEYEFAPDAQTSIKGNKAEDAYFNDQFREGADFIGLAGLLVSAFVPINKSKSKPSNKREVISEVDMVTNAVQHRFGIAYITENFNIPEEKVNEFIYFVEDNGIDKELLRPENELLLIEFLSEQSEDFLKQINEK